MDTGKIPQVILPVTATGVLTQSGKERAGVQNTKISPQADFQLDLGGTSSKQLAELEQMLQSRQNVLQSLPTDVRQLVESLLQQFSVKQEGVSQGLVYLLRSQKNLAQQLAYLSNNLQNAALLKKPENATLQTFVVNEGRSLAQRTANIAVLPETAVAVNGEESDSWQAQNSLQAQNETTLPSPQTGTAPPVILQRLLQITQQLADQPVSTAENLQLLVQQFGQKHLPENWQSLLTASPQITAQLQQMAAAIVPQVLQQAATEYEQPEIAQVWTVLNLAGAWQFKDLNFLQLTHASAALRQMTQWLKDESGQQEPAQLKELVQSLPDQVQQVLEQILGQGNVTEKMQVLADNLRNMAWLQENGFGNEPPGTAVNFQSNLQSKPQASTYVNQEAHSFLDELSVQLNDKSPLQSAENANDFLKVVSQFMNNKEQANQLQDLSERFNDMLSTDTGSFEDKEANLFQQQVTTFSGNPPVAVQETADKYQMPELPKQYALLKALETNPWQNADRETLEKAAAAIKNLAQQIYRPADWQVDKQSGHNMLSFTLPVTFADGTVYPAYLHIYQQKEEDAGGRGKQYETWLRICVDTENLGTVSTVFRLYDDNKLDVRVGIPDREGKVEFAQNMDSVREKLAGGKFSLHEFLVNQA
jgi:hypothetical protein